MNFKLPILILTIKGTCYVPSRAQDCFICENEKFSFVYNMLGYGGGFTLQEGDQAKTSLVFKFIWMISAWKAEYSWNNWEM